MRAVKESRTIDRRNHALLLASCMAAVCCPFIVSNTAHGGDEVITPQIAIDQFGWLPWSGKVAILAEPIKGQNAEKAYRPGSRFEIRREPDGAVVYRGATKPWNQGKVSELAGDRVWFADFSELRTPGTYYLHDSTNRVRSFSFRIADDVYTPVLRDSMRVSVLPG